MVAIANEDEKAKGTIELAPIRVILASCVNNNKRRKI